MMMKMTKTFFHSEKTMMVAFNKILMISRRHLKNLKEEELKLDLKLEEA